MLLPDKQTNKPTNQHRKKQNLLGGGNYLFVGPTVYTSYLIWLVSRCRSFMGLFWFLILYNVQAEKHRAELQGELNVLNERLESATTSAQLQVG